MRVGELCAGYGGLALALGASPAWVAGPLADRIEQLLDAGRWGRYAAAIAHWEGITGTVAPDPIQVGPRGGRRLAPPLVEWLMGVPAGWVTGVPGVGRAAQLRTHPPGGRCCVLPQGEAGLKHGGQRDRTNQEETMYKYAAFDPRPTAEAARANQRIVEAATGGLYGVEVTVPALAAHCGLGNLDPQHSGGTNIAACVAALSCALPWGGATLVTVRPDADALVAMAVLAIRARSGCVREDRVRLIGDADSAPSGPWVRNYRPPAEFAEINAVAMNFREPLEARVNRIDAWVGGGNGTIPELIPVCEDDLHAQLSGCGRYAVVTGSGDAGRGAMAAGYRVAPIVIGVNPAFTLPGRGDSEPHLKYTIARWNTSVDMDWDGLKAALFTAEPGWGARDATSIIGSPQGVGSTLTLDQVTQILEANL